MSLLFGGGQKSKPQFTGLSAQTSTSDIPITIGFGKNRSSHNIIWQGDFASHKQKQKAGKGGPSSTTYSYSGSFILALGWGVVASVNRVWKDQSKITDYTALGFSLFTGTTPQSPWGFMTASHSAQALGYPGIAYLAAANYDLGSGNQLPQHSFEISWPLVGTQVNGNGDADPAQVIQSFLTNPSYGVGFDFTVFQQSAIFSGANATTTGDAAYQTYCRAMGFGMSPVLSSQVTARDALDRWANLTNTALVWNGYLIKMRPYGSATVTANGVVYLPDFPIRYYLSDKDFLGNKDDPITFDRTDPADAKNGFSLTISNRANEYNPLPVSWRDQGLVDQYGFRKEAPMDAKEVCEPAMAAVMVALLGQRQAYVRNHFTFKLGPQFVLLEPMDVVQCTDARLGTFLVLITDVDEDDNGELTIKAEEYNGSTSLPPTMTTQAVSNTPIDTGELPGNVNTPIIFEAPLSLTMSAAATPQIWIAASGGDGTNANANWGGCYVWASTDGTTYNQIGTIDSAARMGVTAASLAAYGGANPDVTNTLQVNLDMSGGDLVDGTAADAAAYRTLCYVGGEFLSYQTATQTAGAHRFTLGSLYRGLYGSAPSAHASASKFARLDTSIFKYSLPVQYIGKTLYLKLQSFNRFGASLQDLSTCTAYTFTPTGSAFGTGTSGAPAAVSGFSGAAGAASARLSWTANVANDGVTQYKVYRAAGLSASFGSAALIATTSPAVTSYQDTSAVASTAYTYFVVAVNAVGASAASAGVNITTLASGSGLTLWSVTATGTGSSQNITLPYSGTDKRAIFVKVNGLVFANTEYTVTGTTLTLTTNASGDAIEIVGISQ